MAGNTQRPNFYLLLELSYDPPEADVTVIAQAISDKTRDWNRNANNSKRSLEINENRSLLPEIKRIMLESPDERLEEAKQAKKIIHMQEQNNQHSKMQEMKRAVTILCLSENVTEAGLYTIAQQTGVAYEDVLAHVPKNIVIKKNNTAEERPTSKTDDIKMAKIADFLAHLNVKPSVGRIVTVYDFLDLAEDTENKKVVDLASKMYNDLLRKPKSSKVDAQKELCSYVKTIFKDDAERQKYDYTIQLLRFDQIESLIDILGGQGVINSATFDQLKVHGVEQGLTEEQVDELVKAYCQRNNYSLYLQNDVVGQPNVDILKCAHCLHLNEQAATRCQKCGGALYEECIACQTTSPSTAKGCVKCGLSFAQMTKYKELIKKGKTALILKKMSEAEEHFLKAKLLIETAEITHLLHKVADQQNQVKHLVEQATQLIQYKKYYQAQALLQQMQHITTDHTVIEQLKQQIDYMQSMLDEQYTMIMALPVNERIKPILDVLARCADCPWAMDMISTLPPLPPTDFAVEISHNKALLSWTPAENDVTYKIYRTELEKPSRLLDGQLIIETENTHFEDVKIEPNVKYWYSIYTYRGTIRAQKVSIFGPIMCYVEAEQFEVSLNDAVVQMKWSLPKNTQFLLVKAEGEAPKTVKAGTVIAKGHGGTFKDMDVEIGQEYGYTIFTYTEKNGHSVISKGVSRQITVIDAKPVQQMTVTYSQSMAILSWENEQQLPVKLYRGTDVFSYQQGQCIPLAELPKSLENKMLVTNTTLDGAELECIADEGEYILPVSIVENLAVVGEVAFVKHVERVRQLEIQRAEHGIRLTFEWPKDVQSVIVCYDEKLFDGQQSEQSLIIDEQTYRSNQGVLIEAPLNAAYYFAIFSRFERDGHYNFSEPEHSYFSIADPFRMPYSIEKKGLFKKTYSLNIKLADGQKVVPGFIIVKKRGSQPLNAADGQVIAQFNMMTLDGLSGLDLIQLEENTLKLNITAHSDSDTYLRIFFQSNHDAKRFILEPIGKLEIK